MGIPDENSWFRNRYIPTGLATGWRRTGCLMMLLAAMALIVILIIGAGAAALLR